MSAPQFGKTSTAQYGKTTTQHPVTATRFTRKSNEKSSRKERGTLHQSQIVSAQRATGPGIERPATGFDFAEARSCHIPGRKETVAARIHVSRTDRPVRSVGIDAAAGAHDS